MNDADLKLVENQINNAISDVQVYFICAMVAICLIGIFKLIVIKIVKNKSKDKKSEIPDSGTPFKQKK
ncbi:hypothetical protein [Moraxella sp. Pampa]|uniref:hypothetical protein n=1 Tax=Moraxella sp. Pampa TaxID=3111978 RepID=UPI002B4152E0|nr:hypothetical protein [Moraxella sp. Pampa]